MAGNKPRGLSDRHLWRKRRSGGTIPAVSRLRALRCVAALVCALTWASPPGPATAFSLKENPFLQQGEKLTASGVSELAEQGSSVAVSSDGDTALVGAPAYNGFKGATWVYVRSGAVWTQQAKLEGKVASALAHQGASVALSADGNTALIGAPEDTGKAEEYDGAAFVFTREAPPGRNSRSWWRRRARLPKQRKGRVCRCCQRQHSIIGAMDNEFPTAAGA